MTCNGPAALRRLGAFCSAGITAVGLGYLSVIAAWLSLSGTPSQPIADPWLAWMDVLTILSALAIVGLAVAIWGMRPPGRSLVALGALVSGLAGSLTTIGVHFVQLTAVRQLWRSGAIADYRLVWPSVSFAIEYFAWDFLLGLHMVLLALSLQGRADQRSASRVLLVGGVLCLAGLAGPLTGLMPIQNVAVAGYGVLLPVGALLLHRSFREGGREAESV